MLYGDLTPTRKRPMSPNGRPSELLLRSCSTFALLILPVLVTDGVQIFGTSVGHVSPSVDLCRLILTWTIHDRLPEWMCLWLRDLFNLWEITESIQDLVTQLMED